MARDASTSMMMPTITSIRELSEYAKNAGPRIAPVHWAAGSDGETNFGVTLVAAPKAASSRVAIYSFTARLAVSGSRSLIHSEPGIDRCLQSHAPGDRPAPPLQGKTNKTAVLGPAPTDPTWPVPVADCVNVRESLFAEAFNR